ncbi:MAG TPA: carboxypeptidase regulatory-like domain-containing protein, partial [Acidobacteriaceae bacterium]
MTSNYRYRSLSVGDRLNDPHGLPNHASQRYSAVSLQKSPRQHRLLAAIFAVVSPLLLLVFCAPALQAQNTGEITGTVSDSTGAVIPRATVTITALGTGESHTAQTNGSGLFDFTGLDNGRYNLSAQMAGFTSFKKNNIILNVAQTLKEDVSLTAGAANQTVTVEANALQVQSETSEVSTLITGQQMVQLATNGRNVISLTSIGTGVSTTNPSFNGVTAQGSSFNLSFNGMRPDHNNWLIDGGEVYDRGSGGKLDVMPSPDVLSEFQVLASNYTPDYGIASGGTVTMVLKSGTKSFHGGLWEFNRNDIFDANNYFSKQAHQPSPELRLNIFGGDIGGPVWIPHVYNRDKNKTFFFWSEEWRKFIQGANPSEENTIAASDFPTAGQDFTYVPFGSDLDPVKGLKKCPVSGSGVGIICVPVTNDPKYVGPGGLYEQDGLTAGTPFPNNTIPANLIDPNAVLFMGTGAIPAPNSGSDSPQDQYIASPKQPTYVREDVVRIDQIFSDRFHLLGSWIHDQMSQTEIPTQWSGDSYATVGDVFKNPSWAAVIKLTQTLSPTLLNETALNVNGNTIDVTPTGIYQQPSGWSAGSFFPGNNLLNRLPQIGFGGSPLGSTYTVIYWPWHNSFLDYQFRDDLSKIWGKHSTKFGFSYMRMDKNQQLQADTEGDYNFNPGDYSQNPYTNFLLGFASSYQQLQTQRTGHYINNTYSFYAQDDWHATRRLTLNLGLRYDAMPHVYDKFNQLGNFNPAAYSASSAQSPDPLTGNLDPTGAGFQTVNGEPFYLNGIQVSGQNGVSPGFVNNDFATIQPRLGFAYDLFGNGRTVIRGGAGTFYERVQGNDTYNINTTPPFSYQPKANDVYFSDPNTSADTGATATTPFQPAGLTNENVHYPDPGTAQYSIGVQHEIAPSVVAYIGYVGTVGWDQNDLREINDLNFSSPVAEREAVAGNGTVPCDSTVPAADCVDGFVSKNANLYRPYQGYSNIRQEENEVNATYNSLQASVRMENKHGLTVEFAYTWSHEIDIQSGDLTTSDQQGSGGTLSNPYDPGYDRGSGNFDRRHIFNANYIYNLPFYLHSGNGFQRTVLGGWEIAGVTVAESGVPLNVYYNGSDTLGLGGNTTNRPNLGSQVTYAKTQQNWFSAGSFTAPIAPWEAGGTTGYGDVGKNSIVGPGLVNWNISLYKDILFTSHEGPRLQLRAESYNTFNHTEFSGVDTGFTDSNFGRVTSTADPRVLQFGAKFL